MVVQARVIMGAFVIPSVCRVCGAVHLRLRPNDSVLVSIRRHRNAYIDRRKAPPVIIMDVKGHVAMSRPRLIDQIIWPLLAS
jgi:hypothetical protein